MSKTMGEKIATIEEIKKYCETALNGEVGMDWALIQIKKLVNSN